MSALVMSGSETISISGTPARLKSTPLLRSKCVLLPTSSSRCARVMWTRASAGETPAPPLAGGTPAPLSPNSNSTYPLAVLGLASVVAGAGGHELMVEIQGKVAPEEAIGPLQITALAVGLVGLGVAWSTHKSGKQRLVPESADPYLKGVEAIDGLTKSLAASFRRFADMVASKVDPVISQVSPDLIRRSMLSTSGLLCQLQGGSLRLYALAVLASSTLLALFVLVLSRLTAGGGQ